VLSSSNISPNPLLISTVNSQSAPLRDVVSNHLVYYPTPVNLNYFWSFGSLAGIIFGLQLVTGIFLAMNYTPHVLLAFSSVDHIMSDVPGGYLFRYLHANGASFIFIFIYLHIARNLYYQSYLTHMSLWNTGVVIFLLMMATAFIGYVLPWGQMSFWGATVITSLVTAVPFIGEEIAYWVWGGFSISNATLNRFFSLHYLLPFLVTGVILVHLAFLHMRGSSDPTKVTGPFRYTLPFHPYFVHKDLFGVLSAFVVFLGVMYYYPNLLGHSDNFIPANPLVTPAHIVPEWYFTPFYAILRACPDKLGGAIGMFSAIVLLLAIPFYSYVTVCQAGALGVYSSAAKIQYAWFLTIFLTLIFLGSNPAAAPYVLASKLFTIGYFLYFLIIIPLFGSTLFYSFNKM
jgi:quinol-cytochrome oxidoreductase complex cytochrome b subunit